MTIRHYYDTLKEPYKSQAYRNAENRNLDGYVGSFYEAINLFNWAESQTRGQGQEYWRHIANNPESYLITLDDKIKIIVNLQLSCPKTWKDFLSFLDQKGFNDLIDHNTIEKSFLARLYIGFLLEFIENKLGQVFAQKIKREEGREDEDEYMNCINYIPYRKCKININTNRDLYSAIEEFFTTYESNG